jgi:drug/metabolite transporter (DMT)-like permease
VAQPDLQSTRESARVLGVLALGLSAALLASAFFNVGIALQGIEARSAPAALGLHESLLVLLVHRRRWVLGWLLGILGVAPQVLAFAEAPFVVVQPALAAGLLILLFLGAKLFHEPVGPAEVAGVFAIIGGIALLTWGAPGHSEAHRSGYAVVGVTAAVCLVALLPFAVRGTRLDSGLLSIVASGCGFGASNIATKLMADDGRGGHWAAAAAWALVAIGIGIAATLTMMSAFQRRPATTVVPVSTAVETFLPVLLEPLFLKEHWSAAPFGGAPILGGLLAALVGTILVSRSRAVSTLAAGQRQSKRPRRHRPGAASPT